MVLLFAVVDDVAALVPVKVGLAFVEIGLAKWAPT